MERRLPVKSVNEYKRPAGLWKIASAALAVLSVASIYAAHFIMARLSPISVVAARNSWIAWLFIPVPLASVIFSIVKKKRGMRYKGNYTVGIIMAILLAVYGALGVGITTLGGALSFDSSHVLALEEATGVDLPDEYVDLLTINSTTGWRRTEMLLDSDEAEKMLAEVKDDNRWLSPMPSELTEILTVAGRELSDGSFGLVYVTETGLFNEFPAEAGTYHCIQISFDPAGGRIVAHEYTASLD